ncbi:MAG: GNAT family N-acetyltransferase [Sphingomonas sp.]|jgi:hypothetical protein|uniref:GNAT family N-acetyltransferase n=1 Tax=Sphingomonas sp. TaxID=28214 RepID=UPI0035627112
MTKPMLLSEFTRLPPASRACPLDGLSAAIDIVAGAAPPSHRFLRYQYYAAALAIYGGAARTMLVECDGDPVIALPFVRIGPAAARLAAVPGVDAPFRGFPAAVDAPDTAYDTLIVALGAELNALRIGPVAEGDVGFAALRGAASRRGWAALDRPAPAPIRCAPRQTEADTHQTLDGAALAAGGFERLAAFGDARVVAFWRAAAMDSVLAAMLSAQIVLRDGVPAAFLLHLSGRDVPLLVASGGDAAPPMAPPDAPMRDWLLIRPGLPALLGRALGGLWFRGTVDPGPLASL